MNRKEPKNSEKYYWTDHAKYKMLFYGLSPQRITRVIRTPQRIEEGIVDKTVAVMQPTSIKSGKDGKRTWGSEIWVMYTLAKSKKLKAKGPLLNHKDISNKLRIISAWRYPGISPERDPVPVEILQEIHSIL